MSDLPEGGCPEPLRRAFLDLLSFTLVTIRNRPDELRFCQALADHLHNVPALLADFDPDRLPFYWEVERPCFLRALEAIGRQPPGAFDEPGATIEAEYRRACPAGSS